MRRFLLTLTFVSVSAWTQPPQQQAQPPIPVKIEMPPESIWTALLKVVLPTILGAGLGAGITLYGLRQTNKHNAAENQANREHQLAVEIAKAEIAAKYRSQDNRWEFRKAIYVDLITTIERIDSMNTKAQMSVAKGEPLPPEYEQTITDGLQNLFTTAHLAPLATSDSVLSLLMTFTNDLSGSSDRLSQVRNS
jgi:hypothetical protein